LSFAFSLERHVGAYCFSYLSPVFPKDWNTFTKLTPKRSDFFAQFNMGTNDFAHRLGQIIETTFPRAKAS
jgi:hypothetical protein